MQRPGYRSSEFYVTAAVLLISIVWGSGLIGDGTAADKALSLIASVAAQFGYTVSRGLVKSAEAKALAPAAATSVTTNVSQ